MNNTADKPVCHILAFSGGKDSSAFALFINGDPIRIAYRIGMIYGDGFDRRSLYMFLQFYRRFPTVDSLSPQSGGVLSWTHYRKLLQVESDDALKWYINEAAGEGWGVRTLQRNISSQYYERTLLSQNKEAVKNEMVRVTAPLQDKLEFIKNPVVAEFLGLSQRTDFTESDLETCILDNLGKLLHKLATIDKMDALSLYTQILPHFIAEMKSAK